MLKRYHTVCRSDHFEHVLSFRPVDIAMIYLNIFTVYFATSFSRNRQETDVVHESFESSIPPTGLSNEKEAALENSLGFFTLLHFTSVLASVFLRAWNRCSPLSRGRASYSWRRWQRSSVGQTIRILAETLKGENGAHLVRAWWKKPTTTKFVNKVKAGQTTLTIKRAWYH